MGTILNSAAAPRPPSGELRTFAAVEKIGLWCSYTTDDEQVGLAHVWINGQWVDALGLFGWAQFDRWCDAVEKAAISDASAQADEVAESLPPFEAALMRARSRATEAGVDLGACTAMDDTGAWAAASPSAVGVHA